MTLYHAYLNYKRKRKEIEQDLEIDSSKLELLSPELMVEFFTRFANTKEVV